MSILIETPFGKLRKVQHYVQDGRSFNYVWECPACGSRGGIDDKQLAGQVSIVCDATGKCPWHETHDFRPFVHETA